MSKKKEMKYVGTKAFATLWAAGTIGAATLLPGNLAGRLSDAYEYFSHSGQSVSEMARGTRGERGIKNLEEALAIVENASGDYESADEGLQSYIEKTRGLTESLKRTYEENENFSREAQRMYVQLTGMMKNVGEAGNSLKPGFMRNVDDAIMRIYGVDPIEAREKSTKAQEFYDEALKFYNSREDHENALGAFSDFLSEIPDELKEENNRVNEILGRIDGTLRETYTVEDKIFQEAPGVSDWVTGKTPGNIEKKVSGYSGRVASVKGEVEEFTPVPDRGYDWITFLLNPLVLGAGFAVGGRMAIEGLAPGIIKRPLNKVLAFPAHLVTSGIGKAYSVGRSLFKRDNENPERSPNNANLYKSKSHWNL